MKAVPADGLTQTGIVEGADKKFYGIYECFPDGRVACVGVLQHACSAETYKRLLLDTYQYREMTYRPKILIVEMHDDLVRLYMLWELRKNMAKEEEKIN